jgi:predicted nucleotidyltransferase
MIQEDKGAFSMAKIPNNLINSLDSFLKEIEPICSLDKVILYGSLAKGNINKNSDIDLAIFSRSCQI